MSIFYDIIHYFTSSSIYVFAGRPTLTYPCTGVHKRMTLTQIKQFMCFKHKGALSTQSGKPLKLVDQFIYLGSNISSTESDVKISLTKAWNAIDMLAIICKSD